MRKNVRRSGEPRRPPPQLDEERLRDLAVRYVGRYATTRYKLGVYLARKLRERGWDGEHPPEIDVLVARMDDLGFVDDEAYAGAKARSLTARGYGMRRIGQALYAAGVEEPDRAEAQEEAAAKAFDAARTFARKRRIGPYAERLADPDKRRKQLAAFMRAGHGFTLARSFVDSQPGAMPEPQPD